MRKASQKITIIGVTEAGCMALAPDARAKIKTADYIFASKRFHATIDADGEIESWPSPFSDLTARLEAVDGNIVILATGDPLWFGVGASLIAHFGHERCAIMPAVSGFQMAASRMGWPLASCETVTVHGRPITSIVPYLYPRARLLVLTANCQSAADIATLLVDYGYGSAQMTALGDIGGDQEARHDGVASTWAHTNISDFHIMAITVPEDVGAAGMALSDSLFETDGKMTKRDLRASALAKLAPFPDAVLWDVGAGSGAVSIDFLRHAPRGKAYAIDRDAAQIKRAVNNAMRHGVGAPTNDPDAAGFHALHATLPDALADLPPADAIFIGGGLSPAVITLCQKRLRAGGVLVAHAVTLESEAILLSSWQATKGDLTRIAVNHADPVGGYHGWRALMPVTQWVWHKDANISGNGT
ncbi:precorrin-6y C5,15-methyltransferase (decarboxylating) subunit CbiE [uncultured Candidatus Puniceispirillum sp.]|jgi:precorrin-6B C5,15-methyltransferase / cobalt-precorrin-6B C5,C15-methyltransferase|uniref:precorrin-6y C5,15-methyltransferase (decarboxylating) subunit CbiE n=1 Tax=uncultured Candidatus Puniceispirillum sp. TaxID=1985115 RepID=UPI0032B30D58